MIKKRAHHDLVGVQAKFSTVQSLEITRTALGNARKLGMGRDQIVEVVQALRPTDFIKSEIAHSPPNPHVWHDTYVIGWDGMRVYLKFAGSTLVDVVLTSFKEQ